MTLYIAVDGPSGAGKSTVCRAVARELGMAYLDTGAMYRIITLAALRAGLTPDHTQEIVDLLNSIDISVSADPEATRFYLNGEDVTSEIRDAEVTAQVSAISAIPEVREKLVELQRELASSGSGAIVDGRDIGTVVLPDAPLKIFLTASPEERARRRVEQDRAEGREAHFDEVLASVVARDTADSTRAVSPLRQAEDAIVVDSTGNEFSQTVAIIAQVARDVQSIERPTSSATQEAAVPHNTDNTTEGVDASWDGSDDALLAGQYDADLDEYDDSNEEAWERLAAEYLADDEEDRGYEEELLPVVAVVGRPNVGKSTLVNRFIGRREAIVEDFPGVTRDRNSYEALWNGRRFMVTDTGGWEPDAKGMHKEIAHQAEMAMTTADIIVLVVDATVGVTITDEIVARSLLRSDIPVLVAANKSDSPNADGDAAEFWALGLGEPHPISSLHGRGAADLLDEIVEMLPEKPRRGESSLTGVRRIALVGKPNVGKSSLLNKLAGESRSVVDDASGTTVDPVDSIVELDGRLWHFVDTAGLRKRVGQAQGHEYYASLRTQAAIEAAEVVIMLIDASQPITEQDQRVVNMVLEAGRAVILAYNKWDLVDEDRRHELEREIERDLKQLSWAKRVNISATTGRALQKLVPAIDEALESWDKRISTSQLNQWLKEVVAATPPPMRGGRLPRVLFATQAATRPPTFALFTTRFLEAGYRRFLERKLRESFGFTGSPIRISVRVREKRRK